jgi:hypothetical protein
MPRPRLDLARKVKDILRHVEALPPEAATPLSHYKRSSADHWNLLRYLDSKVTSQAHYPAVFDRHKLLLHCMVLVGLVETFERFVKEVAAVCVDVVVPFALDKRFDEYLVKGNDLAAHFHSGTLGKSLCEADTWLDCEDINRRFRKLLADPFEPGTFYPFPQTNNQGPATEQFRFRTMNVVFQLRHTIVHNVGVITPSDAVKLRLLSQEQVQPMRRLTPSRDDVRYVKQFLDETAEAVSARVGRRLAELMTNLRQNHGMLIDPQETANRLTEQFGLVLTVDGVAGSLPPA